MIVQISSYSLMVKYSLVGCITLIMYIIVDGRYVETGDVSFLSLFLVLYI